MQVYTSEPLVSYKEIPQNHVKIETENFSIEIAPVSTSENTGDIDNIVKLENFPKEELENIRPIILNMLRNGPLVGEPIAGSKVIIKNKGASKDINISELLDALTKALIELKTEISEPYYKFEIVTKPDFMGSVLNEISRRGGKIENVVGEEKDTISIRGILPVRTSLGLPGTIREISHGNAYIQLVFYKYIIAEGKTRESILDELRRKKGLL